jgi:hypothetical protein
MLNQLLFKRKKLYIVQSTIFTETRQVQKDYLNTSLLLFDCTPIKSVISLKLKLISIKVFKTKKETFEPILPKDQIDFERLTTSSLNLTDLNRSGSNLIDFGRTTFDFRFKTLSSTFQTLFTNSRH